MLGQAEAAAGGLNREGIAPKGMPKNLLTVTVEDGTVVVVPVRGPVSTDAEGLGACLAVKGVGSAVMV